MDYNIELLNTKITQIKAYIKSTDIIHLYNNLIIDDYKISNFDPIESMINDIYNNLEHCALDGLTPNEVLARVQNVCA